MKNFIIILALTFFSCNLFANTRTETIPKNITPDNLSQLYSLAESYYYKNDPKAMHIANLVAEKSLAFEQMDQYASVTELMGRIYLYQGNMSKAQKCFETSLSYWENLKDTSHISFLYGYFAELNFLRCNYPKADSLYHKSLNLKIKIKDSLNYAYSYNALGNIKFETCHYPEALSLYRKSLNINKKNNNISGICYTLNALGKAYLETNNINLAKTYFDEALELGKKHKLQKNIAYSLIQLGYVQNNLGNRNSAIHSFNKAIELCKELDSKHGKASSYMGIGEVFLSMDQNDKAIEYQHKALRIFQKIGSKKNIAKCYENIGRILKSLNDYSFAKENYDKAIKIYQEIGFIKGTAEVYRRSGNTYLSENQDSLALIQYKKSLKIQKSIKNLKGIAACYTNMGLIYLNKGNLPQSEELFNRSANINKKIKYTGGIGSVYNNLAALYLAKADTSKAIYYLNASLDLATKINRRTLMAENNRNLSDIYASLNNYKKSLNYYKNYVDLYNQLYNAQSENRIGWIQMQNEKEKRENLVHMHAKEQSIKEEKLKKEKLNNNFLISIIGLIIIFTSILVYFYHSVKKSNKRLNLEIEERKKAEALIEDHQHNLESLVKIRTLELLKAKDKAEQADRLKTSFLANMSHEIRTPMNAIIGFSKLMAMTNSKEKHKYYTNIITDNGHILLTLVNDIIDISMLESNQIKIKKSNFSLIPIFEELKQIFDEQKVKAGKNKIQINLIIPKGVKNIFMHSDLVRLKQILINLLRNALKFTESGQIDFGFELINKNIRFFVKDTGIGIPKEEQTTIYDRFRQASNNTIQHGGTGLGLTISKNLVELLGGKIWFNSESDKGSQFFIDFNLDDQNVLKIPHKEQAKEKMDLSGKNILVAEDVESNFLYINEVLKKVNANVTWSQDGIETVEKFQGSHYDLVLMDIQLPKINGYQATVQIKKQDPSVPIVAQSAYTFKDENVKIHEAGCDAFISKPYTEDELLSIISKNMS
ncbi:tetratricopeptide repeat protein [Marinifilum sp. RC60d5]|uniref:tetratricopeptide repeat protein n=1 Tax=Marinifilum sp. RC60d5 TaxID=3458414 RepID=UPI0040361979